ncbi:MAG: AAA family ATPase [Aquabacterium sp.]|nr:MAG: AAA family ATPase [Aquabacterium sp.]
MATANKKIRLASLEFSASPFRKLRGFKIDFAERLTIIAGHNGIGKSTILGLVANTFGLTGPSDPKSYSGDPFYANVERIVYLALTEVGPAQANPSEAPVVSANVFGASMRKRCSMTQRSRWQRARIVPRTIDPRDGDVVGPDAKIPLPTLYLGIRRLATIGEASEKEVQVRTLDMHVDDRHVMVDFANAVMLGITVTPDVTLQSIKGSLKKTAQPGYPDHEALAVSLGQDCLGSIGTALASFNRLKREMGDDYPGGLLVIDEIDAGFHPHAIDRLVTALKAQARRLDLQIVATTHSPRMIEAVHPEGRGNTRAPDKVVYLIDTRRPRLAENQSLAAILSDMALRDDEPPSKPVLCAYFEDEQAMQFFDALFPRAKRAGLGRRLGVQIKLIALGVGGSHLIGLPSKDPIFKDRVLVVDADTPIPNAAAERGNAIKLPCAAGARGKARSPENTIRLFLRGVVETPAGPLHDAIHGFTITNPSTDRVLATFFDNGVGSSDERESAKAWWVAKWKKLKSWGVLEVWATLHAAEVAEFHRAVEAACTATAMRVKVTALASVTSNA